MSSTAPRRRRHSPAVYRRRRLVVGLALLAVITLIVLLITRPWSGEEPTAAPEPSPSPTATQPPAATATPEPTEPAPEPEPEPEPTPAVAACVAGMVRVEAVTDADAYGQGEQPQLSVRVTNEGAEPCTIDANPAEQVFVVTSGADEIWNSQHCSTSESAPTVVELPPGEPVTSGEPIVWDRTRSSPDTCNVERPVVAGGGASYHLDVTIGGIASSGSKQFLLY